MTLQIICDNSVTTHEVARFLLARCGVHDYNLTKPYSLNEPTIVCGKKYASVYEQLTGHTAKHGQISGGVGYVNDLLQLLSVPTLLPAYERVVKALTTPVIMPEYAIYSAHSLASMQAYLAAFDCSCPIAFDIETNGLYWQADNPGILCVVFAQKKANGVWHTVCIDGNMVHTDKNAKICLQAFFDKCACLVAHNGMFDITWLSQVWGMEVVCHFDTMLMSFQNNLSILRYPNSLKKLTELFFNVPDYSAPLKPYITGKNKGRGFENVPYDMLEHYAIKDVVYTYLLYERMCERSQYYQELYHNRLDIYANINMRGIGVDYPLVQKYTKWLEQISARHLCAIQECAGFPLNPNSPKQLKEYLYHTLSFPVQKGKDGKITTNNAALQVLIEEYPDNPVPTLVAQYRKVNKVLGTYMAGIERLTDTEGARLHESFKLTATISGRIGSEVLLLLPRASNVWGQIVKSCFVAKPGYTFLQCDVSQLEVRVMAYLSQDTKLIDAYRCGRDIHAETAQAIYGDNFTKAQRTLAKSATFSNAYGGTWSTLMRNNGMTKLAAQELYNKYLDTYKGVHKWIQKVHKEGLQNGYVVNEMGRRLDLGIISNANVASTKRLIQNWLIQSFGSDIVMLAIQELIARGVPIVLTVHDSVIAEVPIDKYDYYRDIITGVMESVGNKWLASTEAYPLSVPFVVDVDAPTDRLSPPCDYNDIVDTLLFDELWALMVEDEERG